LVPPWTYLPSLGYTVRPAAQTKYPKTVITERSDALATSMPDPLSNPMAALNSVSDSANSHLGYFSPDIDLADPSYLVGQDGNVRHLMLPDRADPAGSAPVAEKPAESTNGTYPLPPWMVDQFIGAAAPMFATQLNGEKDKVVDTLVPVLMEHPEIFNGVPLIASQGAAAPVAPNNTAVPTNDTAGVTPSP
jgi:hypothetical protein